MKEPERPDSLLTNPKSLYHGPTMAAPSSADSAYSIPQTRFGVGRLIVGRNAPLLSLC